MIHVRAPILLIQDFQITITAEDNLHGVMTILILRIITQEVHSGNLTPTVPRHLQEVLALMAAQEALVAHQTQEGEAEIKLLSYN